MEEQEQEQYIVQEPGVGLRSAMVRLANKWIVQGVLFLESHYMNKQIVMDTSRVRLHGDLSGLLRLGILHMRQIKTYAKSVGKESLQEELNSW